MDGISMKSKSLLLTDEVAVPFAAIRSAVRDAGVAEEDVVVITQCDSLGGKLSNDPSSFEAVVTLSKSPEFLGPKWLAEISKVLVPGGRIFVQTSIVTNENIDKTRAALERKLLIAGFVEVQAVDSVGSVAIKGRKASWTIGSSFAIKKVAKTMPKIQIDADMDLIDEDSLLTEEDLKKPQLPVVGDCEVGATRKACKNCTCGRAEEEEKVLKLELTAEQINNPKSACGSCGLGDAFRCGGCPYKGLPPFKMGEKVRLSGSFLVADI